MQTEAWLRGPLDGIDPLLMPAAHALVQAATDIEQAAQNLTVQELWSRPGGAASVGFHLRHVAGSIDRLFTYARGKQLTAEQHQALALEAIPGEAPAEANALTREVLARIEDALEVVRLTPTETLFEPRAVGRALLPTNVFGLIFHIAEHTQRHTGQIVTTAKIVRSLKTQDGALA
jgi:uncharacterized damage-inducible protein DinB